MVHILLKKIYISNEILRINKFISKNFTTNINKVLISPVLLWKNILVYNGRKYIPLNITKEKIGYKFFELVLTKKNSFKKNNLDYKIKLK